MSKHFTLESHECYAIRNWMGERSMLIDGHHPQDVDTVSDGYLRCWVQLYMTPGEINVAAGRPTPVSV